MHILDDKAFDNKTKKKFHKDFLSDKFSKDFKEKFYSKKLSMEDLFELTEEQIKELKNKNIDRHIKYFLGKRIIIYELGIINILLFNQKTKYFSSINENNKRNNFEIFLNKYYIFKIDDIFKVTDSYKNFEENMVKLFKTKSPDMIPNYSIIKGQFREEYPELFIDDNAPQILKYAFYNKSITIPIIMNNQKDLHYLYNVNLVNSIDSGVLIKTELNEKKEYLIDYYLKNFGNIAALELITKY